MKREFVILQVLIFMVIGSISFAQLNPKLGIPYDEQILYLKTYNDPTFKDRYLEYAKNFQKQVERILQHQEEIKTDTLINGRRIVPVVFHIIHAYGPENISKEQCLDAIEKLNIDFNKLNSDTDAAHVYPPFLPRRADMKIEFRLARIDTNGNYTEGINRIYDEATNFAYYNNVMKKYAWDPKKYLNVFSVKYIYPEGITLPDGAVIGGMSPFPPSNPYSQSLTGGDPWIDGILIRHDCIGSIGTATNMGGAGLNYLNRTFNHELGHYFNLYHTFMVGPLCMLAGLDGCGWSFLGCGDEVDDTPPVKKPNQNTSINCITPGSVNSCTSLMNDEPDMVENYMDYQYGYCTNSFTNGQKARVDAVFQTDRKDLISYENLVATGVLDTNEHVCIPYPDFYWNNNMICAGQSINFYDFSYNGNIETYEWTFPGGTPSTSNAQNPTVQYNTPGIYDVTLKVTNSAGSRTLTKTNVIRVSDPSVAITTPHTETFSNTNLNDWVIINQAGKTWEITDTIGGNNKCLRISNYQLNPAGSYDEIITPAFDISTMNSKANLRFKFKLGYTGQIIPGNSILGTPDDTVYDQLRVYVSTNCGQTWTQRYSKTGPSLCTAPLVKNAPFVADSSHKWREEIISINNLATATNVRFKFRFESRGGNNIYIDDIKLVNDAQSSIEELETSVNLSIKPNPMKDYSEISFNLEENTNITIEITDLIGKTVYKNSANLSSGQHNYKISNSDLGNSGMYFVNIWFNNQKITKKLVVQ